MHHLHKVLPRGTPEEHGISSATLLRFVQEAEQRIDALHSFMLVRHGHVVAEGWWSPYAAEEPHAVYSISKSFTSTAVGIAVAEGKLSVDDLVIKFFPDQTPVNPSGHLSALRVRDLLRLTSGHRTEDVGDFPYRGKEDLIKIFLELPIPHKPGTHFAYDEPGVYVLSAIIQKATGQTLLDYLRPRLFEPLGIANPTWWAGAQGYSLGASGLSIRTEDIASFGQLHLQRGRWQGRQLIPAAWVDAATAMQTSTGSDPHSDWEQGYGYLFWRLRHGFYGSVGFRGQFCVVMPEFDAVVAMTAGTNDPQSVLSLVWDQIVPAFRANALPADPQSAQGLSRKLAGLTLKTLAGEARSPIAAKIAGKPYRFPENAQRIERVTFETRQQDRNIAIVVRIAGTDQRIACGSGAWSKGMLAAQAGEWIPMTGYLGGESSGGIPIAVSGAWSSEDTYTATFCRYQTAFSSTYDMQFSGDELILERKDVGSGNTNPLRLIGKVQA